MIISGGSWKYVDPSKEQYLGHQYEKDGKRAHDKRCDYCRVYMVFDIKNVHEWGDNMKMGFNDWPEKVHCGSSHCTEYHRRVKIHEEKQARLRAQHNTNLFFDLKRQGVIA